MREARRRRVVAADPRRVENESFWRAPPARPAPPGAPAPPPGTAARLFHELARRPAVFGAVLFVLGWFGILVQDGFLRQLVIGAPLFEEPAKVGGAIVVATLLGMRSLWTRLPLALAFGAGFGVFEHFVTYAEEDAFTFASRIAFHAFSTGLNMASFDALQGHHDARLRWFATAPSTVFHYANNVGALLLIVASLAVAAAEVAGLVWTWAMTGSTLATMVAVAARPAAYRAFVQGLARRVVPSWRGRVAT